MHQTITWIIVADSSLAKVFRLGKFPKIEEIGFVEHPESRLRNQDIAGSKPGRAFQSFGVSRHAYQPKSTPKKLEAEKFATFLGDYLTMAHENKEFSALYIIASPSFLGMIRQHIHPSLHKAIIAEIPKDLTTSTSLEIERHLTEL